MWHRLMPLIIRDIMDRRTGLTESMEADTSPSMATDTEGAGTVLTGTTATAAGLGGIAEIAGTEGIGPSATPTPQPAGTAIDAAEINHQSSHSRCMSTERL